MLTNVVYAGRLGIFEEQLPKSVRYYLNDPLAPQS